MKGTKQFKNTSIEEVLGALYGADKAVRSRPGFLNQKTARGGSSLSDVLGSLKNLDRAQRTTQGSVDRALNSTTTLVRSIQNLQEAQGKKLDTISNLFTKRSTAAVQLKLRRSAIGTFISNEISRQFKKLNATRTLRGGGRNLAGLMSGLKTGNLGALAGALTGGAGNSGGMGGAGILALGAILLGGAGIALKSMFSGGSSGDSGAGGSYYGGSGGGGFTPTGVNDPLGLGTGAYPSSGTQKVYKDLSKLKDRGSRNINPGNVTATSARDYLGQVGITERHKRDKNRDAIFATKEAGVAAIVNRMYRYNEHRGKKTIADIITMYAPPNQNKTREYIQFVSSQLGVAPNAPINFRQNPELLGPIVRTIMRMESPGHKAYSEEEINKGIEIGVDEALHGREFAQNKHASFLTAGTSGFGVSAGRIAALGTESGSQATGDVANLNNALFGATANARGTRYKLGAKDLNRGQIDCSGWAQTALRQAGAPKEILEAVTGVDAAHQVLNTGRMTGSLRGTGNLLDGNLKEGMLIGVRNNGGRAQGIGHVGIVVRHPETGELGVSHSSSSKGVHWQPLEGFQRDFRRSGFITSDPLVAQRELDKQKKEEQAKEQQVMMAQSHTSSSTPGSAESTALVAAATSPTSAAPVVQTTSQTPSTSTPPIKELTPEQQGTVDAAEVMLAEAMSGTGANYRDGDENDRALSDALWKAKDHMNADERLVLEEAYAMPRKKENQMGDNGIEMAEALTAYRNMSPEEKAAHIEKLTAQRNNAADKIQQQQTQDNFVAEKQAKIQELEEEQEFLTSNQRRGDDTLKTQLAIEKIEAEKTQVKGEIDAHEATQRGETLTMTQNEKALAEYSKSGGTMFTEYGVDFDSMSPELKAAYERTSTRHARDESEEYIEQRRLASAMEQVDYENYLIEKMGKGQELDDESKQLIREIARGEHDDTMDEETKQAQKALREDHAKQWEKKKQAAIQKLAAVEAQENQANQAKPESPLQENKSTGTGETVKPVVASNTATGGTEKPLQASGNTSAGVVQPVIINNPAPQQKQDTAKNAGGSLPSRVDSQAVLAYQLDPTTPVHS